MLVDPNPPSPRRLNLVALRPEELASLEKEFHLDTFDFDRPHAIITLDPYHYLYLNVKDVEDRSVEREVQRLMAVKPIGSYRGISALSARNTLLNLITMIGVDVEWRPCGSSRDPVIPLQTCYNAQNATQLFCPMVMTFMPKGSL